MTTRDQTEIPSADGDVLAAEDAAEDADPLWKRLDQYYTPAPPVRFLCDRWPWLDGERVVAEPCCGRGDICDVLEAQGNRVVAGDVHPAEGAALPRSTERISRDVAELDATLPSAARHYDECDTVVTNPPYAAETGTAGEVLESIVEWRNPTAALLRLHWLEACSDRQWAWEADDWRRPAWIFILPRIEYDYPGSEGDAGNRGASAWVVWHPWHDGSHPRVDHVSRQELEQYRGQRALFGE